MRMHRLAAVLAAVMTTGVSALIGTAAHAAAPVPLAAVALSSGTVLPGAPPKDVVITVTNKGPGVMTNLMLVIDWESFQYEEINLQPVDPCEPGAIRTTECHMSKSTLQVGATAEWRATLHALPGALGSAGRLVVWPV